MTCKDNYSQKEEVMEVTYERLIELVDEAVKRVVNRHEDTRELSEDEIEAGAMQLLGGGK